MKGAPQEAFHTKSFHNFFSEAEVFCSSPPEWMCTSCLNMVVYSIVYSGIVIRLANVGPIHARLRGNKE